MKDEAPYVLEWVAHHLAVGFTDVLVYTNDCTDDTDTLLKHLEALDIGVHHRENVIPEGIKPHPSMLRRAASEELSCRADWLLVLDADEFLCINHPSGTLDGMVADLNAMERAGDGADLAHLRVVRHPRLVARPGDRPVHPRGARVLEQGLGDQDPVPLDPKHLRLGMHRPIIKSAVPRQRLSRQRSVGERLGPPAGNWFKFRGWRSIRRTVGYDWAQMNHYAVKSMDAYALRKLRGNVNLKKDKYNTDYWSLQDRNEVEDTRICPPPRASGRDHGGAAAGPDSAPPARGRALRGSRRGWPNTSSRPSLSGLCRESLVAASNVPITQVVANPPKARDPPRR